jgi:CRP-like cAMP-binding protein
MAVDRLVAPLLRIPIFVGLRPLQITEIARQAERLVFRRGESITTAGQPGDGAYLVVSGPAERLLRPGFASAGELVEPGSLISEMAMLVEHTHRATVVARDRVLGLKITRRTLHAQMHEDPSLALHFEQRITERLSKIAEELRQIDRVLIACGTSPAREGVTAR